MEIAGMDVSPYTAALFLIYAEILLLTLLPQREGAGRVFRTLVLAGGAAPASAAIAYGIALKLGTTGPLLGDRLLGAGLILEVGSLQLLFVGERLYRSAPPIPVAAGSRAPRR